MSAVPPDGLWSDLAPDVPIALLPVRLETRFGTRADTREDGTPFERPVLRVRIYPDDIAITADAPGLTTEERKAGADFRQSHHAPPSPAEIADPALLVQRRRSCWEVLVRAVGLERAVFISRVAHDEAAVGDAGDAPRARLQPDSWVIVGRSDGATVLTAHIPRVTPDLQTGLTRQPDSSALAPDDPHLIAAEDGLRWLVEFDRAVAAGMAAVLDLDPAVAVRGFDSLLVIGVRAPSADRSPETEAAALGGVLTAHAARDRVGFVPQGTPTNNVGDRRSGWSSQPALFDVYERLFGQAAPGTATGVDALRGGADNATIAAAALGLPEGTLDAVAGATLREQWWSRLMLRALFPVTLGEALTVLARPAKSADDNAYAAFVDQLDTVIPFAVDHVSSFLRARGPLPTLRIGRQPYGFLPILPLRRFVATSEEPQRLAGLARLILGLRPFWEDASGHLPRLDGRAAELTDHVARLNGILGLGPVPNPARYGVIPVTGPLGTALYSYSRDLASLGIDDAAHALDNVEMRAWLSGDVRRLGYRAVVAAAVTQVPRGSIFEQIEAHGVDLLRLPIASTDPKRPAHMATPSKYLELLAALHWQRSYLSLFGEGAPPDLLFQLTRRSLELSGELDALHFLSLFAKERARDVIATSPELRESDLRQGQLAERVLTTKLATLRTANDLALPAAALDKDVLSIVTEHSVSDAISAEIAVLNPGLPATYLAGYPGTRAAIAALGAANLSDDDYTRLVGETLACHANRLDAWCTSFAAQRLHTLRGRRPQGIQVGSWGLVVDLRPAQATQADVPPGWPPAGLPDDLPLSSPRRQIGYVHALSPGHAITAGVLRAGELSHDDGSTVSSLDLTSGRVRIARDLLDAVRNGQPLGAALGYRVERALGDAGAHAAVTELRRRFPQHRRDGGAAGTMAGDDAVVPSEVLDGLDLWRATRGDVLALVAAGERAAVEATLNDLDRAADAVADLVVAEGVHGIVTGRAERAAATFAALGEGGQPPQELTVIAEPRRGVSLTHRLVLVVDDPAGTAGWADTRARARLAPGTERWAERMLGPATGWLVGCDGAAPIALDTLRLCALDVVAEVAAASREQSAGAAGPAGEGAAEPPLVGRVRAATGAGGAPDTGLQRLLALAGAIGDVLAAARPALAPDLLAPPQNDDPAVREVRAPARPSVAELAPITGTIKGLLSDLARAVAAIRDAADLGGVAGNLALLEELSLPSTVPTPATVAAAATPAAFGRSLLAEIDQVLRDAVAGLVAIRVPTDLPDRLAPDRIDAASRDAALDLIAAASPQATGTLTAIARRLGGPPVVPTLAAKSDLAGHLLPDDALGDGTAPVDPLGAAEGWLNRYGRVRARLTDFDDLRLFVEAGGRAHEPLRIAQLPLVPEEGWLGAKLPGRVAPRNTLRQWARPRGPRAHVLVAGDPGGATAQALILDEFHEVLPAETAITAAAVHYDAPNARPPQTVLLAVHPNPAFPWGWQLLAETVEEALTLTRLRAVEMDDLAGLTIDDALPLTYVRGGVDNAPLLEFLELSERKFAMAMIAAVRQEGGNG